MHGSRRRHRNGRFQWMLYQVLEEFLHPQRRHSNRVHMHSRLQSQGQYHLRCFNKVLELCMRRLRQLDRSMGLCFLHRPLALIVQEDQYLFRVDVEPRLSSISSSQILIQQLQLPRHLLTWMNRRMVLLLLGNRKLSRVSYRLTMSRVSLLSWKSVAKPHTSLQ